MTSQVVQQLSFDQIKGPFCQRWQKGVPTWKHPDQGGFDSRKHYVDEITSDTLASAFIIAEHYTRSYPAALRRFVMIRKEEGQGEEIVGMAVFSSPTNRRTLTNAFPDLLPYRESMELGRFVLTSKVESNGESWFLSRCLKLLKRDGVRGIVSFSDPVERKDIQGRIILPGHYGEIYQLFDVLYTGRGTARTLYLLPDGLVLNERSLQKIRAQEKGHEAAEKELIKYGARPLENSDDPHIWLQEALTTIGIRRLRHPGAHRYLFDLSGRVQRQRIGQISLPYPTRESLLT